MQFLISFGVYPNRYGVDKNFDAKMINDDTAYMLRNSEEYNYWGDIFSYLLQAAPVGRHINRHNHAHSVCLHAASCVLC